MDPAMLADRLSSQPALCLEIVNRLKLITGMHVDGTTAAEVIAWAAQFLAAVASAPDPVAFPSPAPAPPAPLAPTGRPQVRVYPDPASHYCFWAVDPGCVALARSVGLLTDADAGQVHDSEVVFRCRGALASADVLFTAAP